MGKNTDKLYITQSEHSGKFGAHGATTGISRTKTEEQSRKLPFNYCSLSLQPFKDACCTVDKDGTATIFDLRNIIQYVHKQGKNPINGASMTTADLIRLRFARNNDDEFVDPVTHKPLTEHSYIVAVRATGNVYLFDTIDRLNIKTKNWTDLVDGTPFKRSDILTIQDPHNVQNHDTTKFAQVSTNSEQSSTDGIDRQMRIEKAKESVMKLRTQTEQTATKLKASQDTKPSLYDRPQSLTNTSTGMTAASFTSTSLTPRTHTELARKNEQEWLLIPRKIQNKGFLQISTSLGPLNLELWPEFAPKAVFNFMMLGKQGYYNNTFFHRNIKGFMIQGGDPSGSGKGGESYWKKNFNDELKNDLSHDRRGIISMANKGRNSNSSQFFVTYGPCKHLDGKHTIFGTLVGGFETLAKMEDVPVDESSHPKDEITINELSTYVDPFEDYLRELDEQEAAEKKRMVEEQRDAQTTWTGKKVRGSNRSVVGPGDSTGGIGGHADTTSSPMLIGKYMKTGQNIEAAHDPTQTPMQEPMKKKPKRAGFGNFDSW